MKKGFDWKLLAPFAALGCICVCAALLLALTNGLTAPVIEENNRNTQMASLREVMPDAEGFEEITLASAPSTVRSVYRETSGLGYVLTLATTSPYSSEEMGITMAVGTDGTVAGITITAYYETKDIGKTTYPQTYVGQDSALSGVTLVSGATYSSTAFRNAVSDGFTALIENGLVSAGEKTLEQKILEQMTAALPGCANQLGIAKTTQIDAPAGFTAAYAADNGSGYVLVREEDGGALIFGVNAFGGVRCLTAEGEDVTDSQQTAAAEAGAALPVLSQTNLDQNLAEALQISGVSGTLTPVEPEGVFGTVVGAFSAEDGSYVFVTENFSYSDLTIRTVYHIGGDGAIAAFGHPTELIAFSEYYSDYTLDEEAYRAGFTGVTEDTLTGDVTAISGATMTATAVHTAAQDAFAAFRALTGGRTE